MIWFDIKELERGLKNGDVSDNMIFNYLLGSLILFSISPYLAGNDSSSNMLIIFEVILTIVITVVGTKRTYEINTAGDRKDYLKRFLSLSFVTGIRLLVFVIIAAIPIGIIMGSLGINKFGNENAKGFFEVVLLSAISIFYYFMLTNSFKRVSQKQIPIL